MKILIKLDYIKRQKHAQYFLHQVLKLRPVLL